MRVSEGQGGLGEDCGVRLDQLPNTVVCLGVHKLLGLDIFDARAVDSALDRLRIELVREFNPDGASF